MTRLQNQWIQIEIGFAFKQITQNIVEQDHPDKYALQAAICDTRVLSSATEYSRTCKY